MIRNRIPAFAAVLVALALSQGCAKDSAPVAAEDMSVPVSLSIEGEAPATRSVLPSTTAFENAINEVTVMSYNGLTGDLEVSRHFTSTRFSLTLTRSVPHNLYVFANMGDMSALAPKSESGVAALSYTIPSYQSISSKGIPMAGTKSIGAAATTAPVSLRRLMAKLILTVDRSALSQGGADSPFTNGSLMVRGVARVLYPFATNGSAARSTDELFSGDTDYESLDSDSPVCEDIVLYVPENRQGVLLPDNGSQMDKSYSNGAFSGLVQADRCTYVEFDGTKEGAEDGVSGEFLYRFYPGADATKSFDLVGGKTYRITLQLTWDGLFTQGNWMVERTGWSDTRSIGLSLNTEDSYEQDIFLELPPGVTDYSYKVYYSPAGLPYSSSMEGGAYRHREYGWTFSLDMVPASTPAGPLASPGGVSVRRLYTGGSFTPYGISVPWDDSLIGECYTVTHHTLDGRHKADVNLDIVEPLINITPVEAVRAWDEYGSENDFVIKVLASSNVPMGYISVRCTNSDISLGGFNPVTGTVTCYWKTANTASTRRTAFVVFEGLDASATCVVYQNGKSSFLIGVDDDGGGADNTYD